MNDLQLSIGVRIKDHLSQGMTKIVGAIKSGTKETKAWSKQLSNDTAMVNQIKKLQQLDRVFSQNANRITATKSELKSLKKQIATTAKPTAKLTKQFTAKQKTLGTLIKAQMRKKKALSELRSGLRTTGVDTKNLTQANNRYQRSIDAVTTKMKSQARVEKRIGEIQRQKSRRLQNAANMTSVGGGMLASGMYLKRKLASPLEKIKATERSKGELQSIMSNEGAQKIVEQGRKTATKIAGMNTAIFAGAAYTIKSAMSGLSADEVANMTTAAAITAKAAKSDLATMAELFAKGSRVFKKHLFKEMGDSEFGNMFGSAIAHTVKNFTTTGTKMASAIRTAGEGASMAGISMGEQLTILGMAQQVLTAEEAGTAYKAMLSNPARAEERMQDEGLDVALLNEQGNVKSMPELLAELESVFGEKLNSRESGLLREIWGDEAMKMIENMWGMGGDIAQSAENNNRVSAKGIAFSQEMLDRMQNNFSDKWDLQRQRWELVQEKIGEALIPLIERLMPHLEALANWVSGWIDRHKNGAAIIVGLVAGFTLLLTTGGGLVIALASLTGAAVSASAALGMMSLKSGMGGSLGAAVASKGKGGKLSKLAKGGGVLAALSGVLTLFSSWSDDKKTTGEKLDDTTEVVGGLGGMWAGAALGASFGTAVPVIGTAIGGLVGGAVGYWGGSELGDLVGDFFNDSEAKDIADRSLAPTVAKGRAPVNSSQKHRGRGAGGVKKVAQIATAVGLATNIADRSLAPTVAKGRAPVNSSQKQVTVTNHFNMTATGTNDPKKFIADAIQQAKQVTSEIMYDSIELMVDEDPIWV